MLSIFGSLDVTSLVPDYYRASASLVLQSIVFATVAIVIYRVVSYIAYRRKLNKIFADLPGPESKHWLYGSFYDFPRTSQERLEKFLDWMNTYAREKKYYRVFSFWGPQIVACHPYSIGQILKTSEPKALGFTGTYRFLRPWIGDGLIMAGGKKWARNRRLLTPAFHFGILKHYVHVYNEVADKLIIKLDGYSKTEETFEAFDVSSQCTLDIILRCAFSSDMDVQSQGKGHPYLKAVKELATGHSLRVNNPWLSIDTIFKMTKLGRTFKKNCDFVHQVSEKVIHERLETMKKSDQKYNDFLDILLTARDDSGVGLTPTEIRDEVDTFLFAGHDTTASAMSWILYSLAGHPDCQRRCQQEVDDILDGRVTDDIEWADIAKMEYLTMCIKEAIRLHTPVAITFRELANELAMGDRVFPSGTIVQINIWSLHHNKEVWENEMDYIPDRFSKDNAAKMDSFQFTPFSAGPRNCIGQNFALYEEKVVMAKILRHFTLELLPGHVVRKRLSAVMRSENGILLQAKRRQRSNQ